MTACIDAIDAFFFLPKSTDLRFKTNGESA